MKSLLLPDSWPGKWSVGLALVFAVVTWLKAEGYSFPPAFLVFALGLAGFVLAFMALLWKKESAFLLLLPILGGGLVMFWFMTKLA